MKVEYINPFLEATKSVISMLCGINPSFGKLFLKTSPYAAESVLIIIGVTGKIKGQIVFSLHYDTAIRIASQMMGGMQVDALDEMAKSAIGELGNMIMGNTSTIFYNQGITIDITPPTILTGERLEISHKATTLCIPVDVGAYGVLEMGVAAEEN